MNTAVVIPCYNHARFLGRAVASAIGQTFPAREVIVVDDGSTEDLSPALQPFPSVQIVRQDNQGLAAARNTGLRLASSERIVFLDADDWLLPGALQAGVRCFQQHPGAAFVYGAYREERDGRAEVHHRPAVGRLDLIRCNWIGMIATAMFDRTRLLDVDGFDTTLRMAEDWDLFLRLSRRWAFASHPEVVATYVRHGENMSDDLAELRRWADEVRVRERGRGLNGREARAWREGAAVLDRFYPPGVPRRLLQRLAGRLQRMLP